MIRGVWITSLMLLCGISTCIDVTWIWIERDPNPKWDVGCATRIGLLDGLVGYKDGDTFEGERAGFGLSIHKPSFQPPFHAVGWMDGCTIGVSSPVVILCVVAGICAIREVRRRRHQHPSAASF